MRPMELSPRLLKLAEQVVPGTLFADIGTDHARLPVWLLERGVIERAIASDLREGPLDRARQTAARRGVTERISFRLGDGLNPLLPGEADVIAIAGMGGETIAAILAAAPWTRTSGARFLLQPMTSAADLRRWLWRNGFAIDREFLVREGDTLYVVLTVTAGEMAPLTPAEEWAGRQDPGLDATERASYLEQTYRRASKALEGLRRSARQEDRAALPEWERLVRGLLEMKEEWDQWQR